MAKEAHRNGKENAVAIVSHGLHCRRVPPQTPRWLARFPRGEQMDRRRRRLALSGLIALELLAAALVLNWVLASGRSRAGGAKPGPTNPPRRVRLAPDLPPELRSAIGAWMAERSGQWIPSESGRAELVIGWRKEWRAQPLAEVVLVPVVPFFSLRDEVALDELRRAWRGRARPTDWVAQLLVSPEMAPALDAGLGERGGEAAVTFVPAGELADRLWAEPGALAVVPFDHLGPRLKVLDVDGVSALDRTPTRSRYPLAVRLWASGEMEEVQALAAWIEAQGMDSNRHPERMTVLLMTGVTALTRGVALEIEARGDPAWPARQIADLLAAADLTHASNEVSFMSGCQPQAETRSFCAKPEYLESLRLAGVDVVELTGNHNLDFGPQYALESLDLYAATGIATFGGGRNEVEARRPLVVVHHGNRLAFLGYNQFGPDYAWASDDGPGAARFTLEAAQVDLAALDDQADIVFVNVQHTESYGATPLPAQAADFQALAEAGAGVVTGSQAHQPQAIAFQDGTPIFYGLGNLFFDQTWSDATRQGLVVRHWIYAGRLIASQLIPIILEENCQPRLAMAHEREAILRAVFAASGW